MYKEVEQIQNGFRQNELYAKKQNKYKMVSDNKNCVQEGRTDVKWFPTARTMCKGVE
jgi:hypothetical protein